MAFGGKENIQIVATARDQASPTLKRLQTNVTALGSKGRGPLGGLLSGLGGISPVAMIGAVGIGVMTSALADGVAGALAEEKQLMRLDQALKNNVKNWDGSNARMEEAATKAMDLAFADDEARESLIKLVTATGNEEEAIRNLSLAQDIARGRNIDLGAATDIVIKANMGNVGALRRLGIELDKGATKTEILMELQKRYAGQAEAYADTTAGKFEAAQKKVDNAMEDVGHTLITTTAGLLSFGDAMKGDTEATEDYFRALGNLVPGMDAVADAVEDATTTTFEFGKVAGEATKNIASGLESGRDEIEAAMIAALGPGTRALETWTEQAERFGDNFTDNLADSLRGNKDVVKDAMDDLMWAINHPLKLQREAARIEGALTSQALQNGLASENPMIRAVAEQQRDLLLAQWQSLTGTAYTQGANAAAALERGLRLFDPVRVQPYVIPGGRFKGKQIPDGQRAAGGPVNAGETYLVGEKGPELLHMGNKSGQVQSNASAFGGREPIRVVSVAELRRLLDEDNGRLLALAPSTNYSR